MPRLAIVCSFNEACGNATYAFVLKKAFEEHLEVDVLPLDLFFLQKRGKYFTKAGDQHIQGIAEKLKTYDYVNIQCEAGLYGASVSDSFRRLKTLIQASPNLILTLHRLDPPARPWWDVVERMFDTRSFQPAIDAIGERAYAGLYRDLIDVCRRHSKTANTWIAVHTKRELRLVRDVYGFANVFDFPITFLLEEERKKISTQLDSSAFRARHNIDEHTKIIGAFGFLGAYKGYQTLIRSLDLMPPNYKLFIFGGQHPQSLRANVEIDPYLGKLLTMIADQDRVRFIGNLPDDHFMEALHFSDAVVLPYLEVGQSMSGVVALALECDANLYCSNNASFREVQRYFGDVFYTFDVGNHIEIAQKILLSNADFSNARNRAFATYNLRNNIRAHLKRFGALNGDEASRSSLT